KSLAEKAKQLKDALTDIEKALYQTQNRSNQDPLNFPIRLTNKLGHLNSLVTINDFPPTEQDELVRKELTQAVEMELEKYDALIGIDLAVFNAEFAKLNLNYLTIE
ncbi:MAG: glycosyl hydrolase, partial [Flavobacteriaceae bacterium]